MQWITKIAREIFGLFVDSGSFALAILVWTGIVWFASLRLRAPFPGGLLLFLGLAAILLRSVLRFSRKG